ncbi:branched-chain amino acid aminotransferase [Streptomyces sp. NBC_00829]|uniref:branched-chain amino acid aminotransferase n=1 Tax=Streptomyces sp. NBC_00829 TaxID=2903679 RepID=UPI0038687A38|nr:branched-chain amino acid aminotransferase [Streptomyces sp. NBC_00829]
MEPAPVTVQLRPAATRLSAAERTARLAHLAFGGAFTEHMVRMRWSTASGWHEAELVPYGPLPMDPAMVGLHYGQVVFEGLKAFRTVRGGLGIFRPDEYARRFRASARRLHMPELPESMFVSAVAELTRQDREWLPNDPNVSLYLRPILFASEPKLALRPATEYQLLVIAFVTEGFFGREPRPVRVWLTDEYTRAAPGGTGAAKYAGNYAATYPAQAQAAEHGCDQVVWLDSAEHSWVEEMGGMNVFFVYGGGVRPRLLTPPLSGTILPGVTRDSVLTLAADLGMDTVEAPISVDRWRADCASGALTEVFACGTAAGISPVGQVRSTTGSWQVRDGKPGEVTMRLARRLSEVQHDESADARRWLFPVD